MGETGCHQPARFGYIIVGAIPKYDILHNAQKVSSKLAKFGRFRANITVFCSRIRRFWWSNQRIYPFVIFRDCTRNAAIILLD